MSRSADPTAALSSRFPSRRALVFGAAGGVGLEAVLLLVEAGWTVGAVDIDATELSARLGSVDTWNRKVDVADQTAVALLVEEFARHAGGIDLLVNAAGIGAAGRFEDTSAEIWREVFDINLLGTVYACQAVLPVMQRQGRGQIVNIASAAAFHALPRISAYNASKAAVLSFSETLAGELRTSGIGVTVKLSTFYRSRLPELTRGTDVDRAMSHHMAENSGLEAAPVAAEMLAAAGAGRLYLVTPRLARVLWRFKRHAPRAYFRVMPRLWSRLLVRAGIE